MAFEACEVAPADLDHAVHVRLAYDYLYEVSVDEADSRLFSQQARTAFIEPDIQAIPQYA